MLAAGRSLRAVAIAAGGVLALAVPQVASAAVTTYRGVASDPTGDAKSTAAGLDITQVRAQYKSDGSTVFTLVTRGKIDGTKHDAAFAVFLGTGSCTKVFMGGGGLLSQPEAGVVFSATSLTKIGKQRPGTGLVKRNTYQVRAKYSAFAGKAPDCFSGALVDPKKHNAVIDDITLSRMSS